MTSRFDRREFLISGGVTTGLIALAPGLRAGAVEQGRLRIVGLEVDYIERPLGLENPRPLLSWRLDSSERNCGQSSYRILVASAEDIIRAGQGDLWDSRKVDSKKSFGIQYQGHELTSRQRCWWSVQVWQHRTDSSVYSEPSWWEMGLLAAQDWQAQWLAAEDILAKADRQAGLRWIWGAPGKTEVARKFRRCFTLTDPARGGVLLAGANRLLNGVWLDGDSLPIERPSRYAIGMQALNEIQLGPLARGRHTLSVEVQSVAHAEGPPESAVTAFLRLQLDDSKTLRITTDSEWLTSLTADTHWYTPGYDDHGWEHVQAAKMMATQPWPPAPAMHLRREFAINRSVTQARLYATALGAYEASLNGRRVGDALLTPEANQFRKRALYRVYDVTPLLHRGANCLGLTVGDGWYASSLFPWGRYPWGPPPRRVLAQLELTFADGSQQVVATDSGWRMRVSPIQGSEIYNGEVVDGRLSSPEWDSAGFNERQWLGAEIAEPPSCRLTSQLSPPIRVTQVLKPVAITAPAQAVHVVDFGQNFAGWCRLRVRGPTGTRIQLRFAELLLPSGEVDQSNLRAAKQTDVFILRGDGAEELFEPKFTYHGFRYVQISGLSGALAADAVEGIVIHSDLRVIGQLRIDHPLIEQIWRNTAWTQRSNFMGVPTDCPQRDERLGFLADASIFWDAAAFIMDVGAFTRRYMQSIADSQTLKGAYPSAAPVPTVDDSPTPAWADGAIILPWTIWQRYGDLGIIEQNWEGMDRYLQFILENNPDHLWRRGCSPVGDWLAVNQKDVDDPTTPFDLFDTAYWAHSVDLMAQMAEATERREKATALRQLHGQIRQTFVETFVRADGRLGNESQTGYVLALKFGLVPNELRAAAIANLVADIRHHGGAFSTGIIGTQYLLDILADAGYGALVYDLLLRTEYPSWGYMIAHGATTIWEGWNGRVWSGGHKNETMPNSYNHYALGAICGFLFRRIAGIDAAAPGFEVIRIRPLLDPRIRKGGGDYDSIMGRISTDWAQLSRGGFTLEVSVPANAIARIHLPATKGSRIREGRKDLAGRGDLQLLNYSDREAVIQVGSGKYHFAVDT
jgi:alpha-L-rhamnosidase